MNQEIKQKWVEALRSGKYKQGHGTLKRYGKYCCLGVLCSVVKTKNWVGGKFLPDHVQEKAGLTVAYPTVRTRDGINQSLANLNDIGMPFSEIADLIEAQL
jgi:hypothetical protein